MTEISTVAIITARPGQGEAVEEALRALAEGTHTEDGCILYSLQRGLADPHVFVTVEKWASQEALEAHLGGQYVQGALQAVGTLLAGPPQIVPTERLEVGDPAKRDY